MTIKHKAFVNVAKAITEPIKEKLNDGDYPELVEGNTDAFDQAQTKRIPGEMVSVIAANDLIERIQGVVKIAKEEGLSDHLIGYTLIREAKYVLQDTEDVRPDGQPADPYELTVNLLRAAQAVLDGEASGEFVGY
jgi:hypothetical protein